jgi:hypothetical protein
MKSKDKPVKKKHELAKKGKKKKKRHAEPIELLKTVTPPVL